MTIKNELESFNQHMNGLFNEHLKEQESKIIKMYLHLDILDKISILYDEYESEPVIKEARADFFSSIYLASNGMYRNSFICLRSALELGLGFIYFVDHNLCYLQWIANEFDLSWFKLNDEDQGVLNKEYCNHFVELDKGKPFRILGIANRNYRICSEYTHGKYDYMKTKLSSKYEYVELSFNEFSARYLEIIDLVIAMHIIRFNKKLHKIFEDEYLLVDLKEVLREMDLEEILKDE
ncbi:MAG: hypothetical protein ACOH15_04885 [Acetobacterium sp.]